MMGRTHVIIGLSYGVALIPAVQANQFTVGQWGLIMTGLAVGSLLPDIDHPHSLISQQIPLVGGIISRLTRHRGLFHSLVGVCLLIIILGLGAYGISEGLTSLGIQQADSATNQICTGILIGYVLHILADLLTVSGVRLFYPLKKTIRIPLFTTGGIGEWVLATALIFISAIQIFSLFGLYPVILV